MTENFSNPLLALAAGCGLNTQTQDNNQTQPEESVTDLIALIAHVDGFTPRDKWIAPILADMSCQDFRTQLLTAIEDYDVKNKNFLAGIRESLHHNNGLYFNP